MIREGSESPPALSVVIPTYNGREDLAACLAALAASDFHDFDVLVVDDGSSEPIEDLVRKHGFRYMRLDDGPAGPARARNRGVEAIRGRHIVFVDTDVCVHSDTLGRFADRFEAEPSLAAAFGSYDDAPSDPGFVSQYKNLFHHYVHRDSDGEISTFWTGCGAIDRQVFVEAGGFDEQRYRVPAIEDIELGTRLHAAGQRVVLDSRIQCTHRKRWTLTNLVRTDVLQRGIPWTRLMLASGGLIGTLNVKPAQRVCVALMALAMACLAMTPFVTGAAWGAVAALAAVTWINRDFYRYLSQRRGVGFALRALPLHWLYFVYCGLSVSIGTLLHKLDSRSEPSADSVPPCPTRPRLETRS